APLGRPAPGRFPPCPFIVLSRGDRKPRAAPFGIRFTCTTIRQAKKCLIFFGPRHSPSTHPQPRGVFTKLEYLILNLSSRNMVVNVSAVVRHRRIDDAMGQAG